MDLFKHLSNRISLMCPLRSTAQKKAGSAVCAGKQRRGQHKQRELDLFPPSDLEMKLQFRSMLAKKKKKQSMKYGKCNNLFTF